MIADGKIESIRSDIVKRRLKNMIRVKEQELADKLGSLFGREYTDALDKVTKYEADEL